MLYSTKKPVPFDKVPAPAATYMLLAADGYGVAAFRRAMTAAGARLHPQAAMEAGLRAGLARILRAEEDAERLGGMIAVLDTYFAGRPGEGPVDDWLAAARDVAAVENLVSAGDEPYAQMLADNAYYHDVAPLNAFRMFCTGWEGAGLPAFRAGPDGQVPRELMAELPAGHVEAAGYGALGLMHLPGRAEKN